MDTNKHELGLQHRRTMAEKLGWRFEFSGGRLLKVVNPQGIWFGGNGDLYARAQVPDATSVAANLKTEI